MLSTPQMVSPTKPTGASLFKIKIFSQGIMIPKFGGTYAYISKAFGPLAMFLYL